mgnify:FL=1
MHPPGPPSGYLPPVATVEDQLQSSKDVLIRALQDNGALHTAMATLRNDLEYWKDQG